MQISAATGFFVSLCRKSISASYHQVSAVSLVAAFPNRERIVLLAAEGRSTRSIAEEIGVQPRIVSNWRRRFADHGLGGLKDHPRAGKKPI
jgi:hypothetical protein